MYKPARCQSISAIVSGLRYSVRLFSYTSGSRNILVGLIVGMEVIPFLFELFNFVDTHEQAGFQSKKVRRVKAGLACV